MKGLKNRFIIEKSQFNKAPRLEFSLSKYCYLLPTGCGHSKSMHELRYKSEYSGSKSDVYSATAYLVTFMYTYYFLWFRLTIGIQQEKMSSGFYAKFEPHSKSDKYVDNFLKP